MPEIRETMTLHESTVKDPPIKTKPRRRLPKSSKVTKVTVDPRVWQTALKLAKGNAKRITITSPTEVIVHNHPQRKRKT